MGRENGNSIDILYIYKYYIYLYICYMLYVSLGVYLLVFSHGNDKEIYYTAHC